MQINVSRPDTPTLVKTKTSAEIFILKLHFQFNTSAEVDPKKFLEFLKDVKIFLSKISD